jgi:3-hydroxymyristoyl/3-hydroxydecanoyl-(acyl carrier protein) dehydratase
MQALETGGLIRRESGSTCARSCGCSRTGYPFLLIDRVLEIDGYRLAVAVKNVSINEPYFQGPLPRGAADAGRPPARGDGAARRRSCCCASSRTPGKLAVLWSIDKVKLRGAVVPGDQLRLEVETLRSKDQSAQVRATGTVAGKLVCEATLMFTMIDA